MTQCYEEFFILGYNAVRTIESHSASLLGALFNPKDRGDMFFGNVG
jgi:hypothetical protein